MSSAPPYWCKGCFSFRQQLSFQCGIFSWQDSPVGKMHYKYKRLPPSKVQCDISKSLWGWRIKMEIGSTSGFRACFEMMPQMHQSCDIVVMLNHALLLLYCYSLLLLYCFPFAYLLLPYCFSLFILYCVANEKCFLITHFEKCACLFNLKAWVDWVDSFWQDVERN